MRKICRITALLGMLLSACNLPTQPVQVTPTADAVATQVAVLLTSMPTATIELAPTPVPSETPAPTIAPTDTLVPTATVTPTVDTSDQPDWREQFDGGKMFYLFENDNTRVTVENGSLVLSGLSANGWHGWSLTYNQKPLNFRVEGIFTPQDCSGADLYGLVFRAPDATSGYFYGVTCDGRYNLHARDFDDGTDSAIIALTSSSAIVSGANQVNRLGVQVEGNTIKLYVNDVLVQQVDDSTFDKAGYLGAFVVANQTAGFTVKLDTISLWNLP